MLSVLHEFLVTWVFFRHINASFTKIRPQNEVDENIISGWNIMRGALSKVWSGYTGQRVYLVAIAKQHLANLCACCLLLHMQVSLSATPYVWFLALFGLYKSVLNLYLPSCTFRGGTCEERNAGSDFQRKRHFSSFLVQKIASLV